MKATEKSKPASKLKLALPRQVNLNFNLSDKQRTRLAAVGVLGSAILVVYMMTPAGPVGPAYRDERLTAGPDPLQFVQVTSVRKELKLTDEQLERIKAKQTAGRGQAQGEAPPQRVVRMGRKHQEVFLRTVLQESQAERLRQLILQQAGALALASKETADAVGLSDRQHDRASAVVDEYARQLNELRASRAQPKAMMEARSAAADELLALLTSEQQQRWQTMTGAPFDMRMGGGGGGGQRGPGGAAAGKGAGPGGGKGGAGKGGGLGGGKGAAQGR